MLFNAERMLLYFLFQCRNDFHDFMRYEFEIQNTVMEPTETKGFENHCVEFRIGNKGEVKPGRRPCY